MICQSAAMAFIFQPLFVGADLVHARPGLWLWLWTDGETVCRIAEMMGV